MAKTIRRMGAWLCLFAIVTLAVTGCGDSSPSRRDDNDDDNRRDPVPTVSLEPTEPTKPSDVPPEENAYELVDLSQYSYLPDTVTRVYKEVSGAGYVVELTTKGFNANMVIQCGISANGTVIDAKCLSSNENLGYEKTYGENFKDKDLAGVEAVDTVSGATLTTLAYKNAVKDALNTVLVLSGAGVDLRTPEQILQDNLNAALPVGKGQFTKLFITEVIEGVDAVYAADNGRGYVAVIGEDFVGVTATGNSHNRVAATAVKTLMDSTSTAVDLTAYKGINKNVVSIHKTATGNYIVVINGLGFGYFGDEDLYQPAKNIPMVIRVSITADGKIIDTLTVSHEESQGFGAACGEEAYYGQFDGKTADTYTAVDGIAGATITTHGYLTAIKHCFEAVAILEEGAES